MRIIPIKGLVGRVESRQRRRRTAREHFGLPDPRGIQLLPEMEACAVGTAVAVNFARVTPCLTSGNCDLASEPR